MEIEYSDTAKEYLRYWKESGNKTIQNKITSLLQSILQDPFKGIEKPEPLKHRVVYRIEGKKIIAISLRFH